MKIIRYFLFILGILSVYACRKSDKNLDVDLSKYNPDKTQSSSLDKWIASTFTDPFNIEVVYRFNRDLGNTARDIAPVELDDVTPMMEAVLNVYLKPYEKIAGKTFIKKFTPKQFVLFGSVSYNTNGSVTLGTADGGRRIVLYDVNNFDPKDISGLKKPMRTIHHEFTHILNQNIAIPPDFEQVTKSDYVVDWTNAAYTDAQAKELGFITRYSRMSYTEDFAEMVAHLLVEGQIWFDNYVATTPNVSAGQKLKKKEEIVVRYFKEYYDIDFRQLQAEVQRVMKETYMAVDPNDLSKTLASYLNNKKVASIQYNPSATHYAAYGDPSIIKSIFNNAQVAAKAQLANDLGWPQGVMTYIEFRFTDETNMVFRVGFKQTPTATTTYVGDYYFKMAVNTGTGVTTFTKTTVDGAHFSGNGAFLTNAFEQYFLPYLTNRIFVASWLPNSIPSTSPLYRTFGGFYVQGAASNYVYGPIVLK
ncbi:substrate import-associated zinc metallohydrolase lipoprotein [Sphingobacterium sp.]|uniref:substrate import-associated zinc metallohydrolase lipoprotein n=1 Tax=Sphingobacterium sp. TaxID=341027 RepID=UPI00289FEF2B|nr:substrate import-associated zinc metallohydrolase lipoprotein [Sphingobacterium sp.]